MPRTFLSTTSELASIVESALGTNTRHRIRCGGSCCGGSSSSGGAFAASTRLSGRLAFFASARSAGAYPCGFWWSGGASMDFVSDDKTLYQPPFILH